MTEFRFGDRVKRTAAYCASEDAGWAGDRSTSEVGRVLRLGGSSFAAEYPVRVEWRSGMVEIYAADMLELWND